ncbi:enoyl-CoA hydratase/isomerase family protein [Amycolatopsis rubida]|uniref:Enoyl-CoA hydratase/isomerase family protein n=1 Tax=Amycolatopsis rubida TaxID=112413 RepID=A0ABX0C3A8_9PSEU|nr:enoyl-CoA hydratase/isomerase family protein [Amycolatopsis sp. M39]MYW96088.1 enoyl-CoA hydratase [Amycolatopsis rubida]NEC61079.1 enoyl-CoA hydratase/isomerase family protein [Amycolatopsis rubida]OAP23401.1 Carnitinyl-CoA dehydratase [Amycolatopsis sp. M39]
MSGVAEVLIDDPRTRNALGTAVLHGIAASVEELSTQDETRVIVLAGAGGTFSSGGNLKEDAPVEDVIAATMRVYAAIAQSPKPVLARVEGNCLGLAVGIMAACDLAIAARETRFALPEPHMGQAPTMAAAIIVPRLRPADANQLLLTGAAFGGDHAYRIGLVNASVPAVELANEQQQWIECLVDGGPVALAACKELVRTMATAERSDALQKAAALTVELADSSEAREGALAFRERRLPAWQETLRDKEIP